MPASARPLEFSADPARSATLPASFYTDPAVFEREQESIWLRSWQFVGFVRDAATPGDYFTATIGDQSVLVVRGKDERLRCFYNVCKHRGHVLVAEEKGNTPLLVCPYHAWGYGLDGALRTAPFTQSVIDFDRADFPLTEVRVATMGILVFVCLDPDVPELDEVACGLFDDIRAAVPGFDHLQVMQSETVEVSANWKLIHDGLECYHCPYIHPQLMGKDGYSDSSWDSTVERHWSKHIAHLKKGDGAAERLPWPVDELAVKHSYVWYLWPNIVFAARPGPPNFQVLRTISDSPDLSRRDVYDLTASESPSDSERGLFRAWREVAWLQDKAAIESQQHGMRSRGYQQGRLVVDPGGAWYSEEGTHHFQYLVWCAVHDLPYEWGGHAGIDRTA